MRLLAAALLALFLGGCVIHVNAPAPPAETMEPSGGPLPSFDTDGLSDYDRHLVFAGRHIEEGDYPTALEELDVAESAQSPTALLYELRAIALDADRRSSEALDNFRKAGWMYLEEGNTGKAMRMAGWLRTFQDGRDEADRLEGKIKGLTGNQ